MRYLVDADALIDAAIGRPRAQRTLNHLSDDGLAVSIIAVAEVYEGAFGTQIRKSPSLGCATS